MKHFLKQFSLAAGLLTAMVAHAAYPDKPIRLVVPFGAGGGTDVLARLLADRLARSLGVSVIVDNKPGAGGTIGTDSVAKARPDGYTLLMGTNATLALAPGLYRQLPYDPIGDLTPITSFASGPSVLVVNVAVPAQDVPSLISYIKSNPDKLNYGSAGNGSMAHIATGLFNQKANVKTVHIPFKGGAAAMQELVAGRLQFMVAGPVETIPLSDAGKVRALAVTSKTRFAGLPNLPTLAEAGLPGYEIANWFGVFGPKALPDEVVQVLVPKVQQVLEDPTVRDAMLKQGVQPEISSAADFRDFVRSEVVRWTRDVKQMNISLD